MQCPNCKKEIPDTSQFCSFCGQELVPDKIQIAPKGIKERHLPQCPNCKRDVAYTSEKCPYCGHKLVPQKAPEEKHIIQCPKCKRDITNTSEKCPYCGYCLTPESFAEKEEMRESNFKNFGENLEGCSNGLFKFGCAWTLLVAIIGILLAFLFGLF